MFSVGGGLLGIGVDSAVGVFGGWLGGLLGVLGTLGVGIIIGGLFGSSSTLFVIVGKKGIGVWVKVADGVEVSVEVLVEVLIDVVVTELVDS